MADLFSFGKLRDHQGRFDLSFSEEQFCQTIFQHPVTLRNHEINRTLRTLHRKTDQTKMTDVARKRHYSCCRISTERRQTKREHLKSNVV